MWVKTVLEFGGAGPNRSKAPSRGQPSEEVVGWMWCVPHNVCSQGHYVGATLWISQVYDVIYQLLCCHICIILNHNMATCMAARVKEMESVVAKPRKVSTGLFILCFCLERAQTEDKLQISSCLLLKQTKKVIETDLLPSHVAPLTTSTYHTATTTTNYCDLFSFQLLRCWC